MVLSLATTMFIVKVAEVRNEMKILAVQQTAVTLATASLLNFVACKGGAATALCAPGITTCAGLTPLVTLPAGFTITGGAALLATGDPATCAVTDADTPPHSAAFKAFGS